MDLNEFASFDWNPGSMYIVESRVPSVEFKFYIEKKKQFFKLLLYLLCVYLYP